MQRMPCPYANVLGTPNEGFHTNVFGVAVGDVVGTVGLAYITNQAYGIDFTKALVGWFVIAEVSHWVFGVDTAVLKALGLSPKCNNNTSQE